ncbi:MAG: prolipoprotein diacylglyceryl transferase [Planctomycetes bacterium]|nr:prolipoprotein diacylglyceryl transferase [Planctomycetota bacterium]
MLPRPYYTLFMLLSLAVFLAARQLLPKSRALARLTWRQRTMLALAGFIGGAFGAKLPFLDTGDGWMVIWFRDGKTITTGLVGAYLGVELAKLALNIRVKTGDSFAIPLALALAVGRWGCFFNGCCAGVPTDLPSGFDFGDGVPRHPTQIYECAFHLGMAIVLAALMGRGSLVDHRLKLYLIAYCGYRFVTEMIRPEPAALLGITFYQAIVVLFAAALVVQWSWEISSRKGAKAQSGVLIDIVERPA